MKKYFKQLKANKKGFTLIEMIVVIAIIGILAAILVPSMAGYLETARDSRKEANAKTVYTAAQAAVTALESSTTPVVNAEYTTIISIDNNGDIKDDVTPGDKTVGESLFKKIKSLIGDSNYKNFTAILVKVTDGAVNGVSVIEKGETKSAEYPKDFKVTVTVPS